MIRIYKDNDIKEVTRGAYKNFYKPLGYNIIIESRTEAPKETPKVDSNKTVTTRESKKVSAPVSAKKNKKEV